jgi:hypothetical protein
MDRPLGVGGFWGVGGGGFGECLWVRKTTTLRPTPTSPHPPSLTHPPPTCPPAHPATQSHNTPSNTLPKNPTRPPSSVMKRKYPGMPTSGVDPALSASWQRQKCSSNTPRPTICLGGVGRGGAGREGPGVWGVRWGGGGRREPGSGVARPAGGPGRARRSGSSSRGRAPAGRLPRPAPAPPRGPAAAAGPSPVDAHALAHVAEVGAGEQAGAVARGAQHALHHGARGALRFWGGGGGNRRLAPPGCVAPRQPPSIAAGPDGSA